MAELPSTSSLRPMDANEEKLAGSTELRRSPLLKPSYQQGVMNWIFAPFRLARNARRATTPVNVRLTREGWQFLFMVCFVILGAVLRDVNLLVILAGTLLALLLIQWRVCSKSVYGLVPYRRLPRAMQARKDFEIELSISNPKRWLGSWLVLAQDRIVFKPTHSSSPQVSQSISVLFQSVPPQSNRTQKYRCRVQRRGNYQFLGTEISTRFPVGLMRGILPALGDGGFVVQPALGKLLPGWLELFDSKITGVKQRKSRSLSDEGDFFGLRAYHPGDSPRWIHWRSTARMNELMVKQYQRADSREFVVVLDLFSPSERSRDGRDLQYRLEDLAVEFVASMANHIASSNTSILTVAIADAHPTVALRIQTRGQNTALLDRLGTAHAGERDGLPRALELLEREYRRIEKLVIVSTRPRPSEFQRSTDDVQPDGSRHSIIFWKSIVWLDATRGELNPYFVPAPSN
jgi:uncharacterized protein (DUF58 family)